MYRDRIKGGPSVAWTPAARGSLEVGFTQPRDHPLADPCIFSQSCIKHPAEFYLISFQLFWLNPLKAKGLNKPFQLPTIRIPPKWGLTDRKTLARRTSKSPPTSWGSSTPTTPWPARSGGKVSGRKRTRSDFFWRVDRWNLTWRYFSNMTDPDRNLHSFLQAVDVSRHKRPGSSNSPIDLTWQQAVWWFE